jgi:hypothetical protein
MWVIQPPQRQAGERAAHDLGEGLDLLVGEVWKVLAQQRCVGCALT